MRAEEYGLEHRRGANHVETDLGLSRNDALRFPPMAISSLAAEKWEPLGHFLPG